jgi:phenylacetate-CoA ligase
MKRALSKKNLWEKTPPLLKSTLGRCLGLIPPKWLLGRSFTENCKFVRDAQWWPAERAREYQLKKLREILILAYEKTGFYRRMFDSVGLQPGDIKTLDNINQLPTIDKQVVNENRLDMCTKNVKGRDVDFGSTGGTSGTPLHFYLSANRHSVEYAYLTRSWERVGYRLGMPMAVLRGRTVRADRNGLRHEYDPILHHHYYSNFHMTGDNMRRYLDHMCSIGPCMLHAYASSAQALANYIIGTGNQGPQNVQGVLLESENVYPDQVHAIERAFHARTFSSYGHSERLVLAVQCEHTHNYHVWPTYGFFELLDDDGKPVCTPGQRGEIVGTGFINTVMPFIRYRTGDWATYVGGRCEACGREHVVLSDIEGRWPQGALIAADGSVVTMTALNVHDDTFNNVREYQFHQSVPGKATLCVVPVTPFDDKEKQRIVMNMNKRLQGQVTLDLEIRTELVKTARGKQPRVIQKCTFPVQRPQFKVN